MAWPGFDSPRAEPQGAKQMAAPAELRTPNMHRAKRIAPRECGWKHGDSGYSAGKNFCQRNKSRTQYEPTIPLTPTGLLMEGDCAQNPFLVTSGLSCPQSSGIGQPESAIARYTNSSTWGRACNKGCGQASYSPLSRSFADPGIPSDLSPRASLIA